MRRIIFTIFVFIVSLVIACAHESLDVRDSFSSANKTYIIRDIVDLGGESIIIPDDCVLIFRKNGQIRNGRLIGNNTKIKAGKRKRLIFQNTLLEGSWKVNKIYSHWLDFRDGEDNTRQIKSLFALCSSDVDNDVYISSGMYLLANTDDSSKSPAIVLVPSNTRVHSDAILAVLPGNQEQSFLFIFWGVSDCLWEGGVIIGDLYSHKNDEGQQGYGVAIRGGKSITIRNVECRECWGDGINLQYGGANGHNENIIIENVKCDRNRRQGISIEDGINVVVRNSTFSNTGQDRGHSPMKGIDIEPWYEQAMIKNVRIENCKLIDNVGGGLGCSFIKPKDSSITIKDIEDVNGGLRFNCCNISSNYPGISVINYRSKAGRLRFNRNVRNIRIEDSFFMSAHKESSKKDTLSNISFYNVSFKTGEQRTLNYYCLSLVCAKTENVVFDKCSFEVLDGSGLSSLLPSGGDMSGVQIRNSTLVDHRKAWFYVPCDIVNSSIQTKRELSFINCKENVPLLFKNNKVRINKVINGSPFMFHSSSNQNYLIEENVFECSGVVDEGHLIVRHKLNRSMPMVSNVHNTFLTR